MNKKILFLTGTRADFGKLKPLMKVVEGSASFECAIFVTGMHTLSRYGYTVDEVKKAGFKNIYMFMNQIHGEPMDLILANTIGGLSRYVQEYDPDMIVVHGDRVEALAGAIVGAFSNILVSHIEGGEMSGTIDGLIRHSVSKLSHLHFVSNNEAFNRLRQLGEDPNTIFIIGSPDIDAMLSQNLPPIDQVRQYYEINFEKYGIVLFHPVTTEVDIIDSQAEDFVDALIESGINYVVIYPNNDQGCEKIFAAYKRLKNNPSFRIFPSLRFEYFLTLLKNARFIIGNSSAGIREAPVFAVPSINIGTRQKGRFYYRSILNVKGDKEEILNAIQKIEMQLPLEPCLHFGEGNSAQRFLEALEEDRLWQTPKQKQFLDLAISSTKRKSVYLR